MYYNNKSNILLAKIDDGLVCLVVDKGLDPSFKNIIFGTGGWRDRFFHGVVNDIYVYQYNINN